jgi:cytochrome c-type biogenesis protein CcmH/NrfF
MEYEEMLPVEKKLVLWSIAIGIILLGILIWVSYTFFPPE